MEWFLLVVECGDLNCVEKPSIYREMKGKKKTMKEIKKENEGKWNLSGKKRNGKWHGGVEINHLIK